jgi:hypothetical protein
MSSDHQRIFVYMSRIVRRRQLRGDQSMYTDRCAGNMSINIDTVRNLYMFMSEQSRKL